MFWLGCLFDNVNHLFILFPLTYCGVNSCTPTQHVSCHFNWCIRVYTGDGWNAIDKGRQCGGEGITTRKILEHRDEFTDSLSKIHIRTSWWGTLICSDEIGGLIMVIITCSFSFPLHSAM